MINICDLAAKDLLKESSILFVEDDETIYSPIVNLFPNIYKNFILATDGEQAKELYEKYKKTINLVVTDYKLPKLNGLELSTYIKNDNPDIPIIMTSASTESEFFINCIKMGINDFLLKPYNLGTTIKTTHTYLKQFFYNQHVDMLNKKNSLLLKESILYRKALDEHNLVSETNEKGIIVYANEYFCKISGYSLEELVGQSHNIVRHPDTPKEVFQELWKNIQSGQQWEGKIKNMAKDGSVYVVNAKIIPIKNEDGKIVKYISSRHLITDLENKQEQAMQHIKETKAKYSQIKEESLKNAKTEAESFFVDKLRSLESDNKILIEKLYDESRKLKQRTTDNEMLEKEVKVLQDKNSTLVELSNKKNIALVEQINSLKQEQKSYSIVLDKLTQELKIVSSEKETMSKEIMVLNKKITDLHHVIEHYEIKIQKLKEQQAMNDKITKKGLWG